MFFQITEKGDGVEVEEYNGKYSLIKAREYQEKIYKSWCREFFKNDLNEKKTPVRVTLGDAETACQVLCDIIEYIKPGYLSKPEPPVSQSQFTADSMPEEHELPF